MAVPFSLRLAMTAFGCAVLSHAAMADVREAAKKKSSQQKISEKKSDRPAAELLVVLGSRGGAHAARNAVNPTDVVTASVLRRTSQTNLTEALAQLMPSVTVAPYGTDMGGLTDSIRLRGLNPDQVLILVNGKRRHSTANIYADAGPQQGSTPADLDMIPMSAIDHIEVLRDGAAAQYGSDAIAGVVNIVLRSADRGGSVDALNGAYGHADGVTTNERATFATSLGSDGYIDLSLDVRYQGYTDHSGIDTRYGRKVDQVFGSPESMRETAAINFAKPLSPGATFYGFLTYAHRNASAHEFYRELSPLYAHGYAPVETTNENDYAFTFGVKGNDFLGFHWDVSSTYGADEMRTGMYHSANSQLYADTGSTPTRFHLGSFHNGQWTNNIDLGRRADFLHMENHVSLGFEHRYENYSIGAGSYASYYGGGASANPGLSPTSAGTWSRNIFAGYVEDDLHPLKSLEIDFAGRLEHYTDVGTTENGKIAARYDISSKIALRGAISTGFRAPTLAEENFANVTVSPSSANGQLAVNSTAAHLLGASALKPERSTNASGGLVINPVRHFHASVDIYQINIRDRIVDGSFYSGNTALDALQQGGFGLPSTIPASAVSAQYFTNGASTRTQGLDISADYMSDFQKYGTVDWMLGINLNRTRIHHLSTDRNGNPLLNAQAVSFLTTATPRSKIILSGTWTLGRYSFLLRETRWGSTTDNLQFTEGNDAFSTSVFQPFMAKARWLTDMELRADVWHGLNLAIGGRNVFNTHPTRVPQDTRLLGVTIYDYYASQVGYNGGFYYVRADYHF